MSSHCISVHSVQPVSAMGLRMIFYLLISAERFQESSLHWPVEMVCNPLVSCSPQEMACLLGGSRELGLRFTPFLGQLYGLDIGK